MINGIIPSQNYELIRDRIGEIIAAEISNQYALTGDEDINADVFVERFVPINHTECPLINISLVNGNFDNQDQKQVDGTYEYAIDCFVNSRTQDTDRGDNLAMIRLHKLLGKCRAIMHNSTYKRLGFDAPSVMNRGVQSLNIADPGKMEATSTVMGSLTLRVKIIEDTQLLFPLDIGSFITTVKLHETEKGYKYGD